jgi:hypothetical protein
VANKYLANSRIKIGSTTYEPGDDITAVLPNTRTIHSWLAANKITKVRTTIAQATANKQKIPTGSDRTQGNVYSTPRTQPAEIFRRGTDV